MCPRRGTHVSARCASRIMGQTSRIQTSSRNHPPGSDAPAWLSSRPCHAEGGLGPHPGTRALFGDCCGQPTSLSRPLVLPRELPTHAAGHLCYDHGSTNSRPEESLHPRLSHSGEQAPSVCTGPLSGRLTARTPRLSVRAHNGLPCAICGFCRFRTDPGPPSQSKSGLNRRKLLLFLTGPNCCRKTGPARTQAALGELEKSGS